MAGVKTPLVLCLVLTPEKLYLNALVSALFVYNILNPTWLVGNKNDHGICNKMVPEVLYSYLTLIRFSLHCLPTAPADSLRWNCWKVDDPDEGRLDMITIAVYIGLSLYTTFIMAAI